MTFLHSLCISPSVEQFFLNGLENYKTIHSRAWDEESPLALFLCTYVFHAKLTGFVFFWVNVDALDPCILKTLILHSFRYDSLRKRTNEYRFSFQDPCFYACFSPIGANSTL